MKLVLSYNRFPSKLTIVTNIVLIMFNISTIRFMVCRDYLLLTILLGNLGCDSHHGPALSDLLIYSNASICFRMAFPLLGISDHVVLPVFIDFPSNSKRDASFHRIAYDYYRADWGCLRDYLRDVSWSDYFFRLYQDNKSFESKVKFRQASNRCRTVLNALKLVYAN